jgi:hypothetical protein
LAQALAAYSLPCLPMLECHATVMQRRSAPLSALALGRERRGGGACAWAGDVIASLGWHLHSTTLATLLASA